MKKNVRVNYIHDKILCFQNIRVITFKLWLVNKKNLSTGLNAFESPEKNNNPSN